MKKIIIFLLLVSVLSVTACTAADDDNTTASTDSITSSDTSSIMSDNESTDDSSDALSDASSAASSVDPHEGWTKVFGNIYIPNLPFEKWEGENQDNINRFTIYINSNDSAAFHAYVKSLPDFGYTIEQLNSYEYQGTDPENRKMHFTDPQNSFMQISIYY